MRIYIHVGDKNFYFFLISCEIDIFISLKVALINGIIMGGGAGLSMNSMFRVVTENTVHFFSTLSYYFLIPL